jgi:hypothetical protein
MNERIKELYTQVCTEQKLPFTVEHNSAVMLDAFANKFALLIVRECAGLMDGRRIEYGNCKDGRVILKHFGVEE